MLLFFIIIIQSTKNAISRILVGVFSPAAADISLEILVCIKNSEVYYNTVFDPMLVLFSLTIFEFPWILTLV